MMDKENGIVVLKKGAYGGYITSKTDFEEGKVYDAIYYNNNTYRKDIFTEEGIKVVVRKCRVICKKVNDRYTVFDISDLGEEEEVEIKGKFIGSYKKTVSQVEFYDKYKVPLEGYVSYDYRDRGCLAYAQVENSPVWQGILKNRSLNGEFIILKREQKESERK